MGRFLRENWIWIAIPIALVLLLLVVVAMMTGSDESSPFVYEIF